MPKVFISYRRDDSIENAGRIYDWLDARLPEDSVFFDVDSILAGTDFREALDKALDQTGVMLAIVGQRWLEVTDNSGRHRLDSPEDFVRVEIETAMQRNITVVPILVQGAPMPSAQQLPESMAPFVYRNALKVRPNPDFNADMGRVARALESYVPDVAVAAAPIAGRGPTMTRGALLPEGQVPTVVEKQVAPPIVPIGAAVRGIHYPWMVQRLLLSYMFMLLGIIAHLALPVVPFWTVFWIVAVILLISMLVYVLTTVRKQRRREWFGRVLGLAIVGALMLPFLVVTGIMDLPIAFFILYLGFAVIPYLGLWAFALFGPTTPALQEPASQSGKG